MYVFLCLLAWSGFMLNHVCIAVVRGEAEVINSFSFSRVDGFSYDTSVNVTDIEKWDPFAQATDDSDSEETEGDSTAAQEGDIIALEAAQGAQAEIIAGITERKNYGRAKNIVSGIWLIFMNMMVSSFIFMALGWSPDIFA